MTAALNHIWNYFNVFARSSFRFLLASSLLVARSPLLLSLCRALPYGQPAASGSVLLEVSGKRVHVPACKQSVRLPFP